MKLPVYSVAILLWIILSTTPASSMDGNELVGVGAIQKGTVGAGVASPKDATWTLLNPAAIVDLDRRLDIGLDVVVSRMRAEPFGPMLMLNLEIPRSDILVTLPNPDAHTLRSNGPSFAPVLGAVWPTKWGAVGAGLFGVQGNKVEFPRSRSLPGAQQKKTDRRAQLEVLKLPLTAAWEVNDKWSVGVSLLAVYSRMRTDSLTVELVPTVGNYAWDESVGGGIILGLYRKWDTFSIGASYTSRQYMTRFKKYKDLIAFRLDFPQKAQVGMSWRPNEKVEVLLDYKFIDWSSVAPMGNTAVYGGLGWRDSHIIKGGFVYSLSSRWTVRTGFSYGRSPIPAESVFTNVLFPAISEKHFSLGFSYMLSRRNQIHFAWVHAFENTQKESGKGDVFSAGGKGTRISLVQDAFTLQYTRQF